MTKQEAEFIVKTIYDLFTDEPVVTVFARRPEEPPRVLIDQKVYRAFLTMKSTELSVGISFTREILVRSGEWEIDAGRRSFHAKTINAHGESTWLTWRLLNDNAGDAFRQAQDELERIRKPKEEKNGDA